MINLGFNKKVFALLMLRAKGDRTLRHYAIECGISYVQLRKLELLRQDSAPGETLIRKLAEHSANDVSFEDLMYAAGYVNESALVDKANSLQKRILTLNSKQLSRLDSYVDFLIFDAAKTKEETQEQ